MLFIIFLSFLFSSIHKSALLCLLTQFCLNGIDLWEHRQNSTPFRGRMKALNVFFFGFLFFLAKDAQYLFFCGAFPMFIPSIFVGLKPFS